MEEGAGFEEDGLLEDGEDSGSSFEEDDEAEEEAIEDEDADEDTLASSSLSPAVGTPSFATTRSV